MLSQLLQPEIKSLIDERKLSTLKEVLSDWSPADIAELIAELSENEQAVVFKHSPRNLLQIPSNTSNLICRYSLRQWGKRKLHRFRPKCHLTIVLHCLKIFQAVPPGR